MRILVCFGTRPEAIKMAPVIRELQDQRMQFKICVTAQHREMMDQVLDFYGIIPDYDLNLMKAEQSLNSLSSIIISQIDPILEEIKPNIVLVQGDTTTAFIAALAAFNNQIKIGHVEAGLRTNNLKSPFPEEANRQMLSRISDFHFSPTLSAKQNLLQENIQNDKIFVTGNTVVDALERSRIRLKEGYQNNEIRNLTTILDSSKKIILVTGHRRENFGNGIRNVCEAILEISLRKDVEIIFPVHLNPKVNLPVRKILEGQENIFLIPPVNYPAFIWLMQNANLIISDSGGVQEEAPSFKTPVIVTRNNSERLEGVKAGFSFLTGTSKNVIVQKANNILDNPPDFSKINNPFGDGRAAERIVEILKENFG